MHLKYTRPVVGCLISFFLIVSFGCQPSLITAVKQGDIQKVKSLLNQGVDINATEPSIGATALFGASFKGQTDMVRILLEKKADPDIPSNNGYTPLYAAIQEGHTEIVDLLIEYETNLDIQSRNGWTALMKAVETRKSTMISKLLDTGAKIDIWNNQNATAMDIACQNKMYNVIKNMLEKGASPNATNNKSKITTFMRACIAGDDQIVLMMLNGADINHTSSTGKTALMCAAEKGKAQIVNYLLQAGAKIDAKDETGATAMHYAATDNYINLVNYFIQYGAQPVIAKGHRDNLLATAICHHMSAIHEAKLGQKEKALHCLKVAARDYKAAADKYKMIAEAMRSSAQSHKANLFWVKQASTAYSVLAAIDMANTNERLRALKGKPMSNPDTITLSIERDNFGVKSTVTSDKVWGIGYMSMPREQIVKLESKAKFLSNRSAFCEQSKLLCQDIISCVQVLDDKDMINQCFLKR